MRKAKRTSPLHTEERTVEGTPVVALRGRLDIDSAPGLRDVLLARLKAHGPRLVLNLGGLEFMDSSGLATLIEAQMNLEERGGAMVLCAVPERIEEVLSMGQVQGMFRLAGTEQEALAALGVPEGEEQGR